MKIILCNECQGINPADRDAHRCPRCDSDSTIDYIYIGEAKNLVAQIVVLNSLFFSAMLLLLFIFR